MVDRDALEQLFAQYGWPMDSKEFPVLREVFTEDAEFTVAITGGDTHGPISGRDAIYDFCSGIVSSQTDQRRHVITNIRIVDDAGDSADVTGDPDADRGRERRSRGEELRALQLRGRAGRRRAALQAHAADPRRALLGRAGDGG